MNTNISNTRLHELHGSGYEIADGEPDISGWTIKDINNRKLGVVDDLLFDPELQKVRYIIANLKNNDFDFERKKVLIPIGVAQLHENNDDVILDVAPWQVRALPTYNGRLADEDEQDMFVIFSGSPAKPDANRKYQPKPQNFYEHSNFNYDNLFRRRSEQMKNRPAKSSFRMRKGVEPTIRDNDAEYDLRRKQVQDLEEIPVSNTNDRVTENEKVRNTDELSNERLLTRIKRMKEDLNDIERDLRNSRDERSI